MGCGVLASTFLGNVGDGFAWCARHRGHRLPERVGQTLRAVGGFAQRRPELARGQDQAFGVSGFGLFPRHEMLLSPEAKDIQLKILL